MNLWPRLKVTCAAILFTGLCFSASVDNVDEYVIGQIKQRNIPGLSLAVVWDGRIIKAAGYGLANMELQVPAAKETVYEIGSITKQFTAEAVILLVEEGKLGLDDPISKYLPDLPQAWAQITVRHLLTHTSGLKDWTTGTEFSSRHEGRRLFNRLPPLRRRQANGHFVCQSRRWRDWC